ncbi:hypothetical protein L1987_51162 [Smallanthus sonchifolius]|uniref:Uncharacterized protein n=1 Tax=Smallanthus sonchifolius TaxID=185202 RepID=A0ACB9ENX1_9ASTR|nr:hypothetical protein L1987_51162 [Smallanthus sonchifolius]
MVPEIPGNIATTIANSTVAALKQAFSAMPELLSHIKSNPTTFTPTAETLKRALSSTFDLCLDWFNQLPSDDDLQQKWTQIDAQYNITETTVDFLKTSVTAVKYLLNDEQFRHWLYIATCFLIFVCGLEEVDGEDDESSGDDCKGFV